MKLKFLTSRIKRPDNEQDERDIFFWLKLSAESRLEFILSFNKLIEKYYNSGNPDRLNNQMILLMFCDILLEFSELEIPETPKEKVQLTGKLLSKYADLF